MRKNWISAFHSKLRLGFPSGVRDLLSRISEGTKRTVLFSIGYITAECRGYFGLSVPRCTWDRCVCSAVQKLGFCASLGSNKCLRGGFLSDGIPWDEIVLVCAVICLKSALLCMCKQNEYDMSWNHMIRSIRLVNTLVASIGKCFLGHIFTSPTARP